MNLRNNLKTGLRKAWSPYNLISKSLFIGTLILTGIQVSLQAQEVQYTQPTWFFGVAGGANFNFYNGSTQQLNTDLTVPATFHEGNGIGLYIAPLVEFHRPDTRLGFMFQAGYDSRKGSFKEVNSPCNCPEELSTDLSYITFEPSLRLAPFKSDFYLYAGPRFAYNMSKSFTYNLGINPAYPEQEATPEVTGDFSNVNKTQISMQVGAGYDIYLSSQNHHTQFVLSPFVSYQPYFGQNPRSIETWNITTVRVGIALKFGRGRKIPVPVKAEVIIPEEVVVIEPEVKFVVYAPENIPVVSNVTEIFPVRNYVFFDLGSTEIPARYVLLNKDQAKAFGEDQIQSTASKNLTGRSGRQMIVYYNVLNILGDRMVKNPSTKITLVGSSEKGNKDGLEMAESVKAYLVNVFGIEASRISAEGQLKPDVPSEQPGATNDLVLLREGDRRVSIESSSPVLLMEFQSGPDAPLKPVKITIAQEAPIESYVTFTAEGGVEAYSSWSLEIRDEKGALQNYGPYTEEKVSIPSKSILGTRPEGDYKVTFIGQTISGKTVTKESSVHMVLWTPPTTNESIRYSILYDFNNSNANKMYKKYLTEVVAPKIPSGGKVIIQGHTDIIGAESYNKELSMNRANDVKGILEKNVVKAGRDNVTFEVNGFGEDEKLAPFENKYPEERFYNRTVIIDIIPEK